MKQRRSVPFVGKTGQMVNWLFEEAGLIPVGSARAINRDLWQKMYRRRDETYERAGIHLTNVLNIHPPGNKIPALCQKERVDGLPGIKGGQYLRAEFYPHLERLRAEILEHRPNVIIGLGAVASWFLLRDPRITKIRGAVAASPYGKVLPTFHPAYLLRGAWKMRPVVTFDLIKAGREAEYPEVRRPPRFVYIPESPDDITSLLTELEHAERLSIDIETVADQITCIGFAWTPDHVLVIPIFDWRQESRSYWSANEEPVIWNLIRSTMRIEGSEGISEWTLRHPLFVEKIWYCAGEVRARYDATTPRPSSGNAEGPWFSGFIILDRAGV
jgi:uracil-DNA glycosylase